MPYVMFFPAALLMSDTLVGACKTCIVIIGRYVLVTVYVSSGTGCACCQGIGGFLGIILSDCHVHCCRNAELSMLK